MRRLFLFALAICGFVWGNVPAKAERVDIHIVLATQKMYVAANGRPTYLWDVATAKRGYVTPKGVFSVTELDEYHVSDEFGPNWCYSRKKGWHHCGAPMTFAIFFSGGKAIHFDPINQRSHGCVHLEYKNAWTLFALVEHYGKHNTIITIQ